MRNGEKKMKLVGENELVLGEKMKKIKTGDDIYGRRKKS